MLTRRQLLGFGAPSRLSGSREPTNGYLIHLSRTAMACRFEATLPIHDQAGVSIVRNALAQADRYEQQLTIFKDTSEVSHINRTAALRPVPVEASLFGLLVLCQELARETDGAFDITSGPLSDCWGFLRRQGRIPEPHEIGKARAVVGIDRLALDRETGTIRFQQPSVRINLGSIGKGYALDRIAAIMGGQVRRCLLSAGFSSFLAIGSEGPNGRQGGWPVGVRHPIARNSRFATLRMSDCAMATSGGEEQYFDHGGKRYGHIIDPRSGWPADQVAGVTVVTDSAAIADALATAFFVGGLEMARQYCSTHSGVLAIMLERGAERPVLFGSNRGCEVQLLRE